MKSNHAFPSVVFIKNTETANTRAANLRPNPQHVINAAMANASVVPEMVLGDVVVPEQALVSEVHLERVVEKPVVKEEKVVAKPVEKPKEATKIVPQVKVAPKVTKPVVAFASKPLAAVKAVDDEDDDSPIIIKKED